MALGIVGLWRIARTANLPPISKSHAPGVSIDCGDVTPPYSSHDQTSNAHFITNGETLHNHSHDNLTQESDITVNDSGAESSLHCANDITRTIPIGDRFSQQQREIYQIVLRAQETAIAAIKPGVEFRQVHQLACITLASSLKDLGVHKNVAGRSSPCWSTYIILSGWARAHA